MHTTRHGIAPFGTYQGPPDRDGDPALFSMLARRTLYMFMYMYFRMYAPLLYTFTLIRNCFFFYVIIIIICMGLSYDTVMCVVGTPLQNFTAWGAHCSSYNSNKLALHALKCITYWPLLILLLETLTKQVLLQFLLMRIGKENSQVTNNFVNFWNEPGLFNVLKKNLLF